MLVSTLVSTLVSAVLQVVVFTLVPFTVYIITKRKLQGFFSYVGVRPAPLRAVGMGALLGLVVSPLMLWVFWVTGAHELLAHPSSQTGQLRLLAEQAGVGPMLGVAFIQAVIATALAEEILFRGFVAKRLIAWAGFSAGNVLQAVLFGGVHLVLFMGAVTALHALGWAVVLFIPTMQALLMGWLNERHGNGSIMPSWCAHAVGNMLTFTVIPLIW